MKLKLAGILFLLLLPVYTAFPDNPDKSSPSSSVTYYCPPCGCCSDEVMLESPGECNSCGMRLITAKSGMTGQTANSMANLFRENAVSNTYFDRLMYPGFILGLLIGTLLLFKSKHNPGNGYLGGLTLTLSIYPFQNRLCEISNAALGGMDLLFLPLSFIMFMGPLALFYTRAIIIDEPKLTRSDFFHLAPGLLAIAGYLHFFLKNEAEKQDLLLSPNMISFSHAEQLVAVSLAFGYVVFSLRKLNSFQDRQNGITARKKSLLWLKRLLFGMASLLCVWAAVLLADLILYDFGLSNLTYYPLWLAIALFLYWIGYQCFFHGKEIFAGNGSSGKIGAYGRNLSAAAVQRHAAALGTIMENKKPYLDASLNLPKLAQELKMNPKDLTIVLNHGLETNFYDFLNKYRLEEAKQKLLDPENRNLTILAIAYDSGFNSKSSFNAIFKKNVKMTPKEFVRRNRP